jgi:hypothetical protein
MAIFYTGKRPVTKGRNWRDASDTYHPIGTYSNRSLLNPSQVLDGAPNTNVVPGADRAYSMPTLLEMVYSGQHHIEPIKNVGGGERLTYHRFHPLEYKGLSGAKAMPTDYGRLPSFQSDYANYSNFVFDGLSIAEPLDNPGHAIRYTATWGGASQPNIHQGVPSVEAIEDAGSGDDTYGYAEINQWFGVPSAKALL